jgi:hypothetical protein
VGNLSATLEGGKVSIIKALIHRRRAWVFIAENRCPLSDVTGRLAEVRRLQHFLTPLSKAGRRRVLGRPRFRFVEVVVFGGMHLHQALREGFAGAELDQLRFLGLSGNGLEANRLSQQLALSFDDDALAPGFDLKPIRKAVEDLIESLPKR